MLGLLYKDYCVLKKQMRSVLPLFLLYSVPMFLPWEKLLAENGLGGVLSAENFVYAHLPAILYCVIFVMLGAIQNSMFSEDERKIWAYYVTSTPLGYQGQVLSKYYFTFVTSFAVILWGYICDNICALTSGHVGSASQIYILYFFIHILMQAIEYPFLIRYGYKHGNTFKVGLLMGICLIVFVYFLFGPLPQNFSLETVFEFLMNVAMDETALPTIVLGVMALLPYVAVGAFYLSYKLSCKWYLKGVECYEV